MPGNNNKKTLLEIKAFDIKQKMASTLKAFPNVSGVGVGYKVKDGKRTSVISIRVYVNKKVAEKELKPEEILPKRIENVPVDVID